VTARGAQSEVVTHRTCLGTSLSVYSLPSLPPSAEVASSLFVSARVLPKGVCPPFYVISFFPLMVSVAREYGTATAPSPLPPLFSRFFLLLLAGGGEGLGERRGKKDHRPSWPPFFFQPRVFFFFSFFLPDRHGTRRSRGHDEVYTSFFPLFFWLSSLFSLFFLFFRSQDAAGWEDSLAVGFQLNRRTARVLPASSSLSF